MFCKDCGTQNPDDAKYCSSCGERLTSPPGEQISQSQTPIKEVKNNYNKWIRALSFIFGAITLSGDLFNGWPYYFESGMPLVLICEILLTLMGILLVLLATFPDYMNNKLSPWIDIESNYVAIVAITILLTFLIVGIEPEPSVGWWNYNGTW
jgi:Predicted membrane protein